jgi:hypothetical protein
MTREDALNLGSTRPKTEEAASFGSWAFGFLSDLGFRPSELGRPCLTIGPYH